MGWTVLRFWREEILNDLSQCIQAVEDTLFEIRLSFYETENVDTYEDGL